MGRVVCACVLSSEKCVSEAGRARGKSDRIRGQGTEFVYSIY